MGSVSCEPGGGTVFLRKLGVKMMAPEKTGTSTTSPSSSPGDGPEKSSGTTSLSPSNLPGSPERMKLSTWPLKSAACICSCSQKCAIHTPPLRIDQHTGTAPGGTASRGDGILPQVCIVELRRRGAPVLLILSHSEN